MQISKQTKHNTSQKYASFMTEIRFNHSKKLIFVSQFILMY